jgi:mRNA-degrading endonuclease RelE of RelBE toxin-antitoxin system
MLIVETSVFTRRVVDSLPDEEYRELQEFLTRHPDAGNVIPGSGGLRKLRWTATGKGKRGGSRIIYYWLSQRDTLLMLFVFKKNEQSDLTKGQLKALKAVVTRELQ